MAANRRNARRSTGPKNTARTRFNALRHGLRATGLTSLDDPREHRTLLAALGSELRPVGTLEGFLLESIALGLVRVRRARRLEAEHVDATCNRPDSLESMLARLDGVPEGGGESTLTAERVVELADGFVRCEMRILPSACNAMLFTLASEVGESNAPSTLPSVFRRTRRMWGLPLKAVKLPPTMIWPLVWRAMHRIGPFAPEPGLKARSSEPGCAYWPAPSARFGSHAQVSSLGHKPLPVGVFSDAYELVGLWPPGSGF